MENIKKFVPVECGKCAHAKVCRFKTDVDKGMGNVSDKNISNDSPFVLTMTCECKQDSIITPKSIVEKPKDDPKIDKEELSKMISDLVKESFLAAGVPPMTNSNFDSTNRNMPNVSTSGVPVSMATTQPMDERTATINQLEELALMDLKSNANHNVEEKVFKKKKH